MFSSFVSSWPSFVLGVFPTCITGPEWVKGEAPAGKMKVGFDARDCCRRQELTVGVQNE